MAKAAEKKKKRTGTVFGGALNIREGASVETGIAGVLEDGAEVEILGEQDGWYKIEGGYVMAKWVK